MNTSFFNLHDVAMIALVALIFCAIATPVHAAIEGNK